MDNIDFDFTKNKEVSSPEKDNTSTNMVSPLTPTTNLFVSGILNRGDQKCVCVLISDNDKEAELRLTAGLLPEVLSSKGYSEDDLSEFKEYLEKNTDEIILTAKQINPMKAFMG